MNLAAVTASITAALFAGTSHNLGFAIYTAILPTGRMVFVAVTRESDRALNPLGIFSMFIGGRVSASDAFDITAAVVREHAAWYRRTNGTDACPLYSPAEVWSRADFRSCFEV